MRVAINQSNYIPWKGYFDLIHDVDLFVFLDDVQYTNRDWRNRNKIKTSDGLLWLSIPVGADTNRMINEVEIRESKWQALHWKSISQYYCRAKFFSKYKIFFEAFYLEKQWTSLSELNQYLITTISKEFLDIKTEFTSSTKLNKSGKKQELICSLLNTTGASDYISGPAAKSYLPEDTLQKSNINLVWKDYFGYPEYSQFYPPFKHDVSILDLLFHTGPDASYYLWGWREEQSNEKTENK